MDEKNELGEIDFGELFRKFWDKKLIIILIVLISAVIGGYYSYNFIMPEYKAKARIILTKNDSEDNETITQTDITLNQQLVNTYTELIKTNNVIDEVINSIDEVQITREELKGNIEVKLISNTQLIEISVKHKDPNYAKELTNKISDVFIEKVKEVYHMSNLKLVDYAKTPTVPYNINHKKDIMTFSILGALVGFGLVFVLFFIDSSISKMEIVERKIGSIGLASVPKYKKNKKKEYELIVMHEPKSPIAEVFRMLRTNLQFMTSNNNVKTVLITSSHEAEGKSFITSNLAVSFAQEGRKVLLVDADMRKGKIANIFDVEKEIGVSNYLSGISSIEDKEDINNYIKQTKIKNVSILTTGDVPPNPSELLESEKLERLIEKAKEQFDLIIFDGTPCLLVTDSVIISKKVDITIIVGKYKETKLGDIEKTKKMLLSVNAKVLGFVINQTPFISKVYKNNYYYGKEKRKKEKKKESK